MEARLTVYEVLKMMPIGQKVMIIHHVEGTVIGSVLALNSMLDNSVKIQRVDVIRTQTEEPNTIVMEVGEE